MAIADRITLLNNGLIEQEGTPTDLYREPATLFAAEFMGNNNRLDGTLVERTDKTATIELMGLRLEGVARSGAPAGEKVTGIIRVEKMLLGGGPGPNRILMTLKTQMYIGERWELVFVKDALTVRAYTSRAAQARVLSPRVSAPTRCGFFDCDAGGFIALFAARRRESGYPSISMACASGGDWIRFRGNDQRSELGVPRRMR